MTSPILTMLITAFAATILFLAGGFSCLYSYRKGVEDEADAVAKYEKEERDRDALIKPKITPFTPPRTTWYITKHAVHLSTCQHLPHLIDTGKATPWPWPETVDEAAQMAKDQNLRACRTCNPFHGESEEQEETWSDEMTDQTDHSNQTT